MSIESAISEDFERYDDADELRRLIRAVRFSQKHFLYFVCCNQVPKQNELIDAVKKEFKGKKIRVVKFKKPVTDLLGELQKKNIAADCEAVFVQGLERSISSDGKGAENNLIYNLNISRDSFKRYLACPLFLWLPEYAIVKITRHAPDFFSVRSGIFYFSNPPEQVTEQIFQSVSSSWNEISSLPIAEKLKQIQTLENLLAEYRGLHKEKQNKHAERMLLSELATLFDSISQFNKAIDYFKEALAISREFGSESNLGIILSDIGSVYQNLSNYKESIQYYEQALEIFRKTKDRRNEGAALGNIGSIYKNLHDYQKAIDYHEQSLLIKRELKDTLGEGNSLGNLGIVYDYLGDFQKAIDYHNQAITIKKEIGNKLGEANSLVNLGTAYYNLSDYQRSIAYYEQSLAIYRRLGNRLGESSTLANLGLSYRSLNNIGKSCELWNEALSIFEAIESPNANVVRKWIEENCGD